NTKARSRSHTSPRIKPPILILPIGAYRESLPSAPSFPFFPSFLSSPSSPSSVDSSPIESNPPVSKRSVTICSHRAESVVLTTFLLTLPQVFLFLAFQNEKLLHLHTYYH